MSKYILQLTVKVMVDAPEFKPYKDDDGTEYTAQDALQNNIDVGSRCWSEQLIKQLAQEIEAAGDGVCTHCWRSEVELVRTATVDDEKHYLIS